MPKLEPTLTLSSKDASSDILSMSVTDALTVTEPTVNLSRVTVGTTLGEVSKANATRIRYFYAKNMDDTNFINLKTAAGVTYAVLYPGEFCWMPQAVSAAGVHAIANNAPCVLEYGYWSKA